MVQDAVRVDHLEARLGEREALGVGHDEVPPLAVQREAEPRDLHGARREVEADAVCAAARELQQVGAHAAADLQQARAGEVVEAHQGRHPRRIVPVAVALDGVEKLPRPRLVPPGAHRAARVLRPLLARPPLFFL